MSAAAEVESVSTATDVPTACVHHLDPEAALCSAPLATWGERVIPCGHDAPLCDGHAAEARDVERELDGTDVIRYCVRCLSLVTAIEWRRL